MLINNNADIYYWIKNKSFFPVQYVSTVCICLLKTFLQQYNFFKVKNSTKKSFFTVGPAQLII